jgi:hypothetical protein
MGVFWAYPRRFPAPSPVPRKRRNPIEEET